MKREEYCIVKGCRVWRLSLYWFQINSVVLIDVTNCPLSYLLSHTAIYSFPLCWDALHSFVFLTPLSSSISSSHCHIMSYLTGINSKWWMEIMWPRSWLRCFPVKYVLILRCVSDSLECSILFCSNVLNFILFYSILMCSILFHFSLYSPLLILTISILTFTTSHTNHNIYIPSLFLSLTQPPWFHSPDSTSLTHPPCLSGPPPSSRRD